jgi:hypothetical protein
MKKALLYLAFTLLIVSQVKAQFVFNGEFRPRFEYRGGYSIILPKGEQPVFTISQRSRLGAYYQAGILTFGLGIQDVRVWGSENTYSFTGVTGSSGSVDLYEAWIGIKPYKEGFIKIGRQYWVYEDERLLSQRNWNQAEVKYDAVLFQNIQKKFQFDIGLSWNNLAENYAQADYTNDKMKSMNFIYMKKSINEWMYISGMALASGFTATDSTTQINWQGSYGAYLSIKKGGLSALGSGYYQNGQNRKGKLTSAYLIAVSGDYLIKKKYSIGAGMDYLSGNDQRNDDPEYSERSHAFDNLYGIRHRVFGNLDLFNNLPKSTGNGGIVDIYLRLKYYPGPKTLIGADFHFFSLQNNVIYGVPQTGPIELLDKNLGQELDLYVSWDINKILNLKGGYSFYLVTDSMEKLQGITPGNSAFPTWIWVMISAKPVFLDTAQK